MNARIGAASVFVLLLPLAVLAQSAFEVASVRLNAGGTSGWHITYTPDSLRASNATLASLIQSAYGIRPDRLVGGPGWVRTSRFDVNAKADQALPREQLRLMAQRLLEGRFGVRLTREQRQQAVYALRLARADGGTGPDLQRAPDCDPEAPSGWTRLQSSTGALPTTSGWCTTPKNIATGLSTIIGVEVVDETALPGRWHFVLAFAALTPDASPAVEPVQLPTIFGAVQEQLGLRLVRNPRGSVEYVRIEAAHKPTEN